MSIFKIIGNFIELALTSVSIGLAAGIFSAMLFKWFRLLCHSAITESILLLIIAMVAYFVSDYAEKSPIISLLTCGISMAHYTWYNLSPQGKTVSSVTFSILGSAAESFVFAYIGLCTFTYAADSSAEEAAGEDFPWSTSFIGWMLAIIIVGRLMAVGIAHGMISLC
jgi:sodium/hydrogen exchanger-like protein 6/7